jgi:hypothetical protein
VRHHQHILIVVKMELKTNFVVLDLTLIQPAVNQRQQLLHQSVLMAPQCQHILTAVLMELKTSFVAKMELQMNFAAQEFT